MSAHDDGIVVTGLGAISPLGATFDASFRACVEGRGAIVSNRFDASEYGPPAFEFPSALIAGDPTPELERRLGRRLNALDPFATYALCAATEAIASAKLGAEVLERAAVVFGHGIGGMRTIEEGYERFFGRRSARIHPTSVPRSMVSSAVSSIAMECGIKGPVYSVSSACSSSGHALIQGAMLLRSGLAQVALVGGSEALATPGGIIVWEGLRAMSKTTCRPFSLGRDGMAIGEGGACLVLETRRHAHERGATVLAELAGFGMSSDAHHWTQPSLEGPVTAMRQACEQAGVLEYGGLLISTHGTGTQLNDANEAAAIEAVFGTRTSSHHVIATKSSHGHLIGASTALQAALAVRAAREGLAPPILNFLEPDPECHLNLVTGSARVVDSSAVVVNSFAFGGLNTTLVFRLPAVS